MSDLLQPPTEMALSDYDHLRDDCGLLDFGHLGLIRMTGEDRKGWLQGQATNDLRQFTPGTFGAFCLCAATGHLQGVFEAWALDDQFLLTTQKETLPAFLTRAEQMVIMEDVEVTDVTGDYHHFSLQGPKATAALSEWTTLPTLDGGRGEIDGIEVFLLRANRTGLGGWDVWIPVEASAVVERFKSAFPKVSYEAYDVARLEAGVPLWGRDMNARTLPPELGSAFEAKHISYSKGCYMGQEVLMRMHSRGHTNRTWMGFQTDQLVEVGSNLSHRMKPDAGVVTSAAWSPDYGFIGAALVRNEVALNREVVTITSAGQPIEAELCSMPILRFD